MSKLPRRNSGPSGCTEAATGMTLLEVMVVAAIVSILVGISGAGIMGVLPSLRLNAAARDLRSDMQQAKVEAVKRSGFCSITFNQDIGGTEWDYVVFVDSDESLEYDANKTIISRNDFDSYESGVAMDSVNFANNTSGCPAVAFTARGLTENHSGGFGAGTVTLVNARGDERDVVLSATGRIRID